LKKLGKQSFKIWKTSSRGNWISNLFKHSLQQKTTRVNIVLLSKNSFD
jgi:hypothetical protein